MKRGGVKANTQIGFERIKRSKSDKSSQHRGRSPGAPAIPER
jgi:hypothetical protein